MDAIVANAMTNAASAVTTVSLMNVQVQVLYTRMGSMSISFVFMVWS